MIFDEKDKSFLYSCLTNIKQEMEYIEYYYTKNFKYIIGDHINENLVNSIQPITDKDITDFSIWYLNEILEKYYNLHSNFIDSANQYYQSLQELNNWAKSCPLAACKVQKYIDKINKNFSFTYASDGNVGLYNESFEAGIIHLMKNYKTMHK